VADRADGERLECSYCHAVETINRDDALRREQASRAEAEALYATLGAAPSWTQRAAARLVGPGVWFLGMAALWWASVNLGRPVREGIKRWWEEAHHERLLHVMSPSSAWVFEQGPLVVVLVLVLVWSLFGERVDARRELQAALAAKPPATPGGPSSCRNCGAPLAYAPGALGVRCASCGADNLLQLPAGWLARARKLDGSLRLSMRVARQRAAEGRRRIRRAASWRVPIVLLLVWFVSQPALNRRQRAGWELLHVRPGNHAGLYRLMLRQAGDMPTTDLRALPRCEDEPAMRILAPKAELRLDGSGWCDATGCTAAAMLALAHGEELRLSWLAPGPLDGKLALADRDYLGGTGVMADGFGTAVATTSLPGGEPGGAVLAAPIAVSGWYKLTLRGPGEVSVLPCVAGAR
jgi:LSD1 subclass zinc finger protein